MDCEVIGIVYVNGKTSEDYGLTLRNVLQVLKLRSQDIWSLVLNAQNYSLKTTLEIYARCMKTLPSVRKCSMESMMCKRIICRVLNSNDGLSCLSRFANFESFLTFFVDSFSHRFIWIPPSLLVLDQLLFGFQQRLG